MIINKVTVGFIVQQFDTEKRKFVSQQFIAEDDHVWEHSNGDQLTNSNEDLALIYGEGGVDELMEACGIHYN
jgi:hypothetical protein